MSWSAAEHHHHVGKQKSWKLLNPTAHRLTPDSFNVVSQIIAVVQSSTSSCSPGFLSLAALAPTV